MYEIGVDKVNYWTYTCSIKLHKNKPSKVFPITKEEFDSFEMWKLNNLKVSNIMQRKQLNADRNNKLSYIYDVIRCECGYSWIHKVDYILNGTEYKTRCPKCGKITKYFKN